jgi:hypothetical protein
VSPTTTKRGKYCICGFGRELAAGFRGTGLDDDRPALDRTRDVKRPAHRQIFALVVEHVQLVRIEIKPAFRIADEGVVRPGIPEAGHDVIKFPRATITFAVLHMIGHAEIQRRVWVGCGDDVPAGAAAAEMVERGEAPGDEVGRIERGRAGSHKPQMLGHHRQGREQRKRLERRDRMAVLERVERHVEHGQMIGHEKRVEFRPLERLREALDVGEIEIGVGKGAGVAPGAGVDGRRPHESAETQLA